MSHQNKYLTSGIVFSRYPNFRQKLLSKTKIVSWLPELNGGGGVIIKKKIMASLITLIFIVAHVSVMVNTGRC